MPLISCERPLMTVGTSKSLALRFLLQKGSLVAEVVLEKCYPQVCSIPEV